MLGVRFIGIAAASGLVLFFIGAVTAHTRERARGWLSQVDDGAQRVDVLAGSGVPVWGEVQPDPLAGVAHGPALPHVAGLGQRGDVLGQRGLADPEQFQRLAELDFPEGLQGRAQPQADGGVDDRVESVRAGLAGLQRELPAVKADVLLLGGARSSTFLKHALDSVEAAVPRTRRITFRGLNHASPWNSDLRGKPGPIAGQLRRFFDPAAK